MIEIMANSRDRILIVESDPSVSDLIGRQALQAVGYQVQVATDATSAIAKSLQWAPDLMLVDLSLPGLSGKDLLVALASQGMHIPMIIIARRGTEADLIQTFRLGAADYLLLPAREAEVVNAVNRVLQQVHDRRERDRLSQQLQLANQELQNRVRELTTIFALGKAMTSVTDQAALLEKILEGAIRITQADLGWFLLRDDVDRPFIVVAESNLPPALGVRLNQPWDDGISSLVAMSGEPLSIHGEALKRFKISSLGTASLIVPIKVQKKVTGLLVMLRRQTNPFGLSEQHLLEALADYASISLANARLFNTIEGRARTLQQVAESSQVSEKIKNETLRAVKNELNRPVSTALAALQQLSKDPSLRLRPDQRQQLAIAQDTLLDIQQIADFINPVQMLKSPGPRSANIADLITQSMHRMQPAARRSGITFGTQITNETMLINVEEGLVAQALDGIISNAVKYSTPGAQVQVCLEKTPDHNAHLFVVNQGKGLDPKEIEKVFEEPSAGRTVGMHVAGSADRFGGLGIHLYLVKEIITRLNGKIWMESQPAKGTILHVRLPLAH
jgi:signal transduction histidine kinase/ActR/RegA family two-component response regulator